MIGEKKKSDDVGSTNKGRKERRKEGRREGERNGHIYQRSKRQERWRESIITREREREREREKE